MKQWWLVRGDELRDIVSQPLRETREKIERDDNECSIGLFVLFGIGLVLLVLSEGCVNDRQTSLIDGLGVFGESSRSGDRDGRQTLPISLLHLNHGCVNLPRAEGRDLDPDHRA